MKHKTLGNSGISVSEIALGCWQFGDYAYWGEQSEQSSIDTVHAAFDVGINFFDTAGGYGDGRSELVLGKALVGRRSEAIIASKVSANQLRPDDLIPACERSLENLQTDYIDLYQIHWPDHDVPLADTMGALLKLQEQGKIRAIGVSNFAVRDTSDALALGECVTNQLPYSLLFRAIEDEVQSLCVDNGVGILCYSSLAQGLLAGRYNSADDVPESIARARWFAGTRPFAAHDGPGAEAETFEAIKAIQKIADEAGVAIATLALAWVRAQPGFTSVLVGARTPEKLDWNLPASELELSDELLSRLDAATQKLKTKLGSSTDMWREPGRTR